MLRLRNSLKPIMALSVVVLTLLALLISAVPSGIFASSHREAPMIGQDPVADTTDVYAFVSPDNANTVTLVANYIPFEVPAAGPNFYHMGDDVLYEFHVDNVGDAKTHITYQYRFYTVIVNPNTFLYNTGVFGRNNDGQYNYRQYYSLTRVDDKGNSTLLAKDLPVVAANVGPTSTPDYNLLTQDAVAQGSLANGIKTFVGPRADPFYADIGALFDLLTIRKLPGNAGGGVNDFANFNVHSMVLQIPRNQLTSDGSDGSDMKNPHSIIGVWATSSRHAMTVRSAAKSQANGEMIQVSRLGNPLVNEVVVPLGAKDLWNSSKPENDKQFLAGVTDPEPARLLNLLYGLKVPATPRNDLVTVFLTGIPGLNQPANVTPSEELRLNMGVPVASSSTYSRFGAAAGDYQGWPNGRRLNDDVVDVALKAVAGGYAFTPATNVSPNKDLGDGVDAPTKQPSNNFPYLAIPYRGFDEQPHP